MLSSFQGFSDGSMVENPLANAGDMGSISGPGRSPGERNGNTFPYSCLENPTDWWAWQSIVPRAAKELDAA